MKIGIRTTALLALTLMAGLGPAFTSQASAQAPDDAYPTQGRAFTLDGTVSQVDADRDRVIVAGDDGRTYTLDTYQSKIVLRNTDRAGETGDLVPGMRLHIAGSQLSRDLIEASRVSVLPYRSTRPNAPVRDPEAPATAPDPHVTLRGTVQSVDDRRGSFVVQVNDHTRKVFLSSHTELRDLDYDNGDHIPLHSGDRVTVVGDLQDDGTVLATLVTPRRLDELTNGSGGDTGAPAPRERALTGRVSKESDYFSRDIKVRLSVDREITVHVPKNIPILRNGHAVSVHDLKDDQPVRVSGDYQNDDFKASRIELLDDSAGDRLGF